MSSTWRELSCVASTIGIVRWQYVGCRLDRREIQQAATHTTLTNA